MPLSKKEREQLLKKHCGVINSDDAIDPKHFFYNKRKAGNQYRKVFQLCRQVESTLHLTLNEGDPYLELEVIDVVPAPDSKRMLVIVQPAMGTSIQSATDAEAMMACLRKQVPRLRAEIARSINRRKTPTLIFELAKTIPAQPDEN